MIIQEVSLSRIDIEDETFRISENPDCDSLENSVRQVGRLYPVILLSQGGAFRIICGFRRLRALKGIGSGRAYARILAEDVGDPLRAFLIALWDKISHSCLGPLEKARVLRTLKDTCRLETDTIAEDYLPLLGLEPHRNVLRSYLSLSGLHAVLRHMFNSGRITLTTAERLAGMSHEVQDAVADLLGKIVLSASSQRQVLDLLDDLAEIGSSACGDILQRPQVLALLADSSLSQHQKGERLRELLCGWRNPRLSSAKKRFASACRSLKLPGEVRLIPDPYFEPPRVRVEFDAYSAERFRALADAMKQASLLEALEELFETR